MPWPADVFPIAFSAPSITEPKLDSPPDESEEVLSAPLCELGGDASGAEEEGEYVWHWPLEPVCPNPSDDLDSTPELRREKSAKAHE